MTSPEKGWTGGRRLNRASCRPNQPNVWATQPKSGCRNFAHERKGGQESMMRAVFLVLSGKEGNLGLPVRGCLR